MMPKLPSLGPERDSEIDRAWRYHSAADGLLHSRVEALLISQAFLVVAYLQIETSSNAIALWPVGYAIIVLALLVSILFLMAGGGLQRGLRYLKETHLVDDPVYGAYLNAVSPNYHRRWFRPRILPVILPMVFMAFWAFVGLHRLSLHLGSVAP